MEEKKYEEGPEKVASINNHYTKAQISEFQREQKSIIYRRRRLTVVFVVAAVILILSGLNFFRGNIEMKQLRAHKAVAVEEQVALDDKLAALNYEVELLNDQTYLEKLARQKYYYTKEGELVFSIPQLNKKMQQEAKKTETKQSTSNE